MRRHSFIVVLKEPGRKGEYLFHTVARSEAEALKIARKFHPRWQHVSTRRDTE